MRRGKTEFGGGLNEQGFFAEGAVGKFVCVRAELEHLAEKQAFGGVSADVVVADLRQIAIGAADDADAGDCQALRP